jgi:5-formyltetrahydrofolate cyclo-ligase
LSQWAGYHCDKDKLRAEIWSSLKREGVAIADPFDRIPNFVGAEQAAAKLATLPMWQQARTIKCNPDTSQISVRSRALKEGKRVYMAVPKLKSERCFVELTPQDLSRRGIAWEEVAIASKALQYGRLVAFEEMAAIDLAIVGCVAVTRQGGRTGKGAGFADLELAMLKTFGLIKDNTLIATTIHPLQIVNDARLPMQPHDWALDWIVTPFEAIATQTTYSRPDGLDWNTIRAEQYEKIPILKKLRELRSSKSKNF